MDEVFRKIKKYGPGFVGRNCPLFLVAAAVASIPVSIMGDVGGIA